MRNIFTPLFLLASGNCFSQHAPAITLDKALANAAPSCFVKPAKQPSPADSVTLKFFDASNAITNCIRLCGSARRYYESVDTTGKTLVPRCFTTYPPLYILDGVALVNNNPSGQDGIRVCISDIQRIDIVKQAETLYGYMGKGGVILVTTKCGPSVKNL